MKGYTLNNTMYVFPQTIGEIPYVGESVTSIMVQQEDLAAWKTANSDYASIMKAYNYNMMTVQKKVWADHLNDDITVPAVDPDLAWSATGASVTIGADDNIFPTLTNTDNVDVVYGSSATGVATINASGTVTLVAAGNSTISAAFEGNAQYNAKTVSYDLTVNDAEIEPEPEVLPEVGTEFNAVSYQNIGDETPYTEGTLTYLGVWEHDNNYIYGTFTVQGQQQSGYPVMAKSDLSKVDTNERFQAYYVADLDATELAPNGYVVISTIPEP